MFGLWQAHRRRRARARPFPVAWEKVLTQNVPYVRRLSPADQVKLEGDILVFLAEKRFEGCAGLAITDEVRVTIAAQACLLLLHRDMDFYPKLRTILVYPSSFITPRTYLGPDGVVAQGHEALTGQSSTLGAVILAWDSVLAGARDTTDGQNVVLHEFAHQLDQEKGTATGAPLLPHGSMYAAWARVLGQEYQRLIEETAVQHPTVMDAYGTTSPAEFFAVATETFFEKPSEMKARHAELYEQLCAFYAQDPAHGT